jgi:hypothetical protein
MDTKQQEIIGKTALLILFLYILIINVGSFVLYMLFPNDCFVDFEEKINAPDQQ